MPRICLNKGLYVQYHTASLTGSSMWVEDIDNILAKDK